MLGARASESQSFRRCNQLKLDVGVSDESQLSEGFGARVGVYCCMCTLYRSNLELELVDCCDVVYFMYLTADMLISQRWPSCASAVAGAAVYHHYLGLARSVPSLRLSRNSIHRCVGIASCTCTWANLHIDGTLSLATLLSR